MQLRERIVERRAAILDRWFAAVIDSYPADARGFLRDEAGRFANPVGVTIREGLERLLGALFDDAARGERAAALEDVLRIRAVQDLAPSRAVGFVLELRGIVREAIPGAAAAELAELDARLDALALDAFDAYVRFREQVWGLRSAEWKNRLFKLLQKANLVHELTEDDGPAGGDERPAGPGGS